MGKVATKFIHLYQDVNQEKKKEKEKAITKENQTLELEGMS